MNLKLLAAATLAAAFVPVLHAQPAPSGDKPTYAVGDAWQWVRADRRTGLKEGESRRTVTAVAGDRVEGSENQGRFVMVDHKSMESPDWVRTGDPRFLDFPLAVGKKWSFKFEQKNNASPNTTRWQYDAEVVAAEKVKVPAGEFEAFKIRYRGYWDGSGGGNGSATLTNWYAPAARATVRSEFAIGRNDWVNELVELKLQP